MEVMNTVNSILGPGTLRTGSDPSLKVEYIPTGVLPLDVLLEGGIPRGRFTEAFGDFSTLKSYIGLRAIASIQSRGGVAALLDTEHSFDPDWAEQVGVDVGSLLLPEIQTGEEAVDATQLLLAEDVDLIVWDSIAATLPQDEANKRLSEENVQPARLAALMSVALRRLNATNRKTAVFCINQTRTKVGLVFGNPESVPGGKSLPFFASYRIAMRKAGRITEKYKGWDGQKEVTINRTIAQKIRCELIKSKLSVPERETWFTWDVRKGEVDELGYLIAVGLERGIIVRRNSSWKWKGQEKTFRGEKSFRGFLESSPQKQELLRSVALGSHEQDKTKGGARRIKF